MNKIKIAVILLLSILLPTIFFSKSISAQTAADFIVDINTTLIYKTEDDFVTVKNEYSRSVKNIQYYLTKDGEKSFHLPDLDSTAEEIEQERVFKLESLSVTDPKGNKVNYKIEELEIGKGIYIHIPFYRVTTTTMPYKIVMTYKTHDNVLLNGQRRTISAYALPKDTIFQKKGEKNGTTTQFNYNLSVITDKDIGPLAKAFPLFTKEEGENTITYKFSQEERIGNIPTLEFGTDAKYRFELEYKTPKTDYTMPEKYSSVFQAISTNIFQLSLPREFEEKKQKVLLDEIYPLPSSIYRDKEGNVIARFELPANKEDAIKISGYITLQRDEYEKKEENPLSITFSNYLESIQGDKGNLEYLKATKYWESDDKYIQDTAKDLLAGKSTLGEVIDADYQFVNDVLEYDISKANSTNERIGAVKALTGGASVCMEYADSMIAILRAQGIPARAALGYTNITDKKAELVRHQWVQIWIPNYGWFSIDPTYESSNRKIGKLVDLVLWETSNDLTLSNISIFSADKEAAIKEADYRVNIQSVSEIPTVNVMSYEEVLPGKNIDSQYQHSVSNWFNSLLKTNFLGRAILITLPVVVLIILTTIVVTVIKVAIQKVRARQRKSSKSV